MEEFELVPLGKRDEPASSGIDGVVATRRDPHVDHRGSLFEGWGMHKLQSDGYFLAQGSVRVALDDGRSGSYNREAPDKYRIDPHSGEIPFDWSLHDG